MNIPAKIPGWRWLAAVVGLYALIWIALEGVLWQVILLAAGLSLISVLYLLRRSLGGRHVSVRRWLLLCAVLGGVAGPGCALLALALMVVKTGLHGHGPEFTPAEIQWLVGQIPLWAIAGSLAGIGLAMLGMAFQRPERSR